MFKQVIKVVTKSWTVIVLQEDFHICNIKELDFSRVRSRCQNILIYVTNKGVKYFGRNKFLILLLYCYFSNLHQVVSGHEIVSSVVFNQDVY